MIFIDDTVAETLKQARKIKPEAEFTCDHLDLMQIKKPLAAKLNTASRVLVFVDDALLFKQYGFMKTLMAELSQVKSPITLVYPNFNSMRTNQEVADEIFTLAKKAGVNNLDTITMHDPVALLGEGEQGYLRFLGRDLGLADSSETRPLMRDDVESFKKD